MALTKAEQQIIENVIARLRCTPIHNWGGIPGNTQHGEADEVRAALTGPAKLYLDTWVIMVLELMLPGEFRDPALGARLSSR